MALGPAESNAEGEAAASLSFPTLELEGGQGPGQALLMDMVALAWALTPSGSKSFLGRLFPLSVVVTLFLAASSASPCL